METGSTGSTVRTGPDWDASEGECVGTSALHTLCTGYSLDYVESEGGGATCQGAWDCAPDEFCGSGACRGLDGEFVTVCLHGVSVSGAPEFTDGPPDLSVRWGSSYATGEWSHSLKADGLQDTCTAVLGECQLWRATAVPGSEILVREVEGTERVDYWGWWTFPSGSSFFGAVVDDGGCVEALLDTADGRSARVAYSVTYR